MPAAKPAPDPPTGDDPELAAQIDALRREHQAKKVAAAAVADVGIRFVFAEETYERAIGASVRVNNTFGHSAGGTIVERAAEGVFRVRIFDNLVVLVHEPDAAWYEQ